jgi:hypothetical protein
MAVDTEERLYQTPDGPAPQYKDALTGKFQPLQGRDGAQFNWITNWPTNFGINNWPSGFDANVTNWPAGFNVNNFPAGFNATVTNWPTSFGINNWPTSFGAVVSNWPAGFNVNNFPTGFNATVTNWPATQTVAGTINVGNWPASFGAVVSNWPASFGAVVSNWPTGFNVNNWPAIQTVTLGVEGILGQAMPGKALFVAGRDSSGNMTALRVRSANTDSPDGSEVLGVDSILRAWNGTNYVRLQTDTNKNLVVSLRSSGGTEPSIGSPADAATLNSINRLAVTSVLYGYNGASHDQLRVDSNKNLKVVAALGTASTGQKAVAVAGTAISIALPTNCRYVEVKGGVKNADCVLIADSVIGSALTTARDGSGNGYELMPGDIVQFEAGATVWINSATAGSYVSYKAVV